MLLKRVWNLRKCVRKNDPVLIWSFCKVSKLKIMLPLNSTSSNPEDFSNIGFYTLSSAIKHNQQFVCCLWPCNRSNHYLIHNLFLSIEHLRPAYMGLSCTSRLLMIDSLVSLLILLIRLHHCRIEGTSTSDSCARSYELEMRSTVIETVNFNYRHSVPLTTQGGVRHILCIIARL